MKKRQVIYLINSSLKLLTELRRMEQHNKNFNKEIENIGKYQTEVTERRIL